MARDVLSFSYLLLTAIKLSLSLCPLHFVGLWATFLRSPSLLLLFRRSVDMCVYIYICMCVMRVRISFYLTHKKTFFLYLRPSHTVAPTDYAKRFRPREYRGRGSRHKAYLLFLFLSSTTYRAITKSNGARVLNVLPMFRDSRG